MLGAVITESRQQLPLHFVFPELRHSGLRAGIHSNATPDPTRATPGLIKRQPCDRLRVKPAMTVRNSSSPEPRHSGLRAGIHARGLEPATLRITRLTGLLAVAMLFAMRCLPPLIGLLTLLTSSYIGVAPPTDAEKLDSIMEHANQPWRGDLDGITKRGFLRILTVHNPLLFSFDGAKQQGMVAELGKMFEDHLAEQIGRVRSPTVVIIPVARD
jgi:hypothetical protein